MLFHILVAGCLAAASSAQRPARQLDLGPSPISNSVQESNFQQPGYLPPIEPAGAQNDPVVLGPTTQNPHPTHDGRDLCTDPFHSFLCANLKPRRPITGALPGGNTLSGASTILEPSKVLAPPLNDLEEPIQTTTTTPKPATTPRPTTTTTRRPTTTTPRPTTRPTTTTTTERPIAPAPSNDVRTYLPPEPIAPAAASQDLTIIKPEPEHHHHHPHHDGRDLCTDPFHSFLCAPLKPRKRITGDRPNSIPAATNQIIAKLKPDRPVEPQPSNEIARAYLPPTTTTTTRRPSTIRFRPEPSNEIPRAYLPPSTTTRRIQPQPSNVITRAYLPPTTTQRIEPQPSNEIPRAYLPPIAPQPSNVENNYLPPIEPAAAQNTPAIAEPDHHHGSHGFKDICSDPFHAFLCTVPKPRTRITGALPEKFRNIGPAASNIAETREKIPAASATGYNFVKPDKKLPLPSEVRPQIASTTSGYSYPKPENKLLLPSDNQPSIISTTRKPTTGYSYPKPDVKLTLPSENQPQYVSTTKKPTTGYSYPKPENKLILPSENQPNLISTTRKPTTGYSYPKPDVKLTLPSENQPTFVSTTQKPTTGYSYPKPENKLLLPTDNQPSRVSTTRKPTTGYSYPKPEVKLTLPSENKPSFLSTTRKPTTGYSYPTPDNKLTLPSEIKTGYDYAKPKTSFPEPTKGYDYPQPTNRLSIPSARPQNALPSSLKEARERLQTSKVANIPNISNQNSVSDLIPVNQVQFPAAGDLGIRFGERLKRRERKTLLIPPPGSRAL